MTKRDIMIDALSFRRPAYVPWAWGPTQKCGQRLREHLGTDNLEAFCESHFIEFSVEPGPWVALDAGHDRDPYGTIWDRTVDKDIGIPCDWPIKTPADLDRYVWPEEKREEPWDAIRRTLAAHPDQFSRFEVGFSLFERAWTMRSMEELLIDMIERPEFVEAFLDRIVEQNLKRIHKAVACGVDAVYFGDDYGSQRGLIMGMAKWRRFFKPRLARMFEPVRKAGKFVFLHSCGQVDSIFDDLVEIGLCCFNPFQPEVMDTLAIMKKYRGRLAFHGGMSIQKWLPFGTVEDVKREARKLIDAGREGGYIFSPSHAVPGDVPPENLVAMMEVLREQPGYKGSAERGVRSAE